MIDETVKLFEDTISYFDIHLQSLDLADKIGIKGMVVREVRAICQEKLRELKTALKKAR
jgi:hypothetical protein